MAVKGQSAVEFLFTYSTAITIVAVAIALAFILSGAGRTAIPSQCSFFGGFTCIDTLLTINAQNGIASQFLVVARDSQPGIINVTSFTATVGGEASTGGYCMPKAVSSGDAIYCLANFTTSVSLGTVYSGSFSLSGNYCPQNATVADNYICTGNSNFTYAGSVRVQSSNSVITPAQKGGYFLLIPVDGSNTLSVVNLSNFAVNTITVGKYPGQMVKSRNGTYVYVANTGNDTVSIINTETLKVVANVTVGSRPNGIVFSPNGAYAYVANYNGGTVSIINTTSLAVRTVTISASGNCLAVNVTPNGRYVFAVDMVQSSTANSIVGIINTTSLAVNTVQVGNGALMVAIPSTGAYAYVPNQGYGTSPTTVAVINTTTFAVREAQVGTRPDWVGFSKGNEYAFVANYGSSTVTVLNPTTLATVNTIKVGTPGSGGGNDPQMVAPTPNGDYMYEINWGDVVSNVIIINATTFATHNVTTSTYGTSVSFSSNSSYAYVSPYFAYHTYVINTVTFATNTFSPGGIEGGGNIEVGPTCNKGTFTLLTCTQLNR